MEDSKKEMDFDELLERFQYLNPKINISEKKSELKQKIQNIFNKYEEIKDSGDQMINDPYDINKNQIDYTLIAEMIYHNKKCFGFIPRKIQILSLLYFLEKAKKNGLVQQINTGEGKSCIISFLAVYIALKERKKIDILTSSPVLAKRDSILFKEFYRSFNLTVDYTSDHNENVRNNNRIFTQDSYDCYKANIVYGDALSFEGDILRTNFMGILGRGKERKFDCIIIDEIDNIALDNLKNTTELLDSFHGYKFLEYVYLFIYKKLKEIVKTKKNVNDEREEIIKELNEECIKEFDDLDKLRKEKYVVIPQHLKKYIHDRLSDWCESAYLAKFIYRNNENYIKRKDSEYNIDVINPIDFYNTGVTQENSVWAGLHQFLQIQEKQMITEENLSSCYMSNLSFFNKYVKIDDERNILENNIYGLTGTIGSEYNKKTLKALYNLDPLIIPPFRNSLLIIEEPNILIMKNDEKKDEKADNKQPKIKKGNQKQISFDKKWFNNIKEKIIEEIMKERSVLVIFQYISEAMRMNDYLNNMDKKLFNKIRLYSRSDKINEGKFLEDVIETRTVILSTNLSGRGTDIRISRKLNDKGGLHVILAYEPFNQRIERQAFGRAGRKGDNGSAGKIIISCMTQEEAIDEMNKREKEESDFLINVYSEKIYVFEKIFDKFSKFISEINERTHNDYLLLDLKERWGLFLIENSINNIEKRYKKNHESIGPNTFKDIENNYNEFEKKLSDYYYEYDLFINSFKNIFKKAKNISNSWNKKPYKFLNGLYLNKEDNVEKINEGIKLCPYLCLGGYMFKIIQYIKEINSNNFYANDNDNNNNEKKKYYQNICNDTIAKIEKNFDILIKCIILLLNQFNTYKNLIGFLGFNKDNLEIFQQNEEKIVLMKEILTLMKNNFKVFQSYKNEEKKNSVFLKVTRFSLKKFIEIKELNINQLVVEYFREYGVCLFKLKGEKKKINKDDSDCLIY